MYKQPKTVVFMMLENMMYWREAADFHAAARTLLWIEANVEVAIKYA